MSGRYIESSLCEQDLSFETPLRPGSFDDFHGQESLKERLKVLIGAAKMRRDSLGHVLLSGPPGLGKTTWAHVLSKEMGSQIVITSGPVIEKAGDLAGLLTNLQDKDILFIDEVHRLQKSLEEYLYPAMEDFCLDLMIDSGPNARSVQVQLNRFTLVAATTQMGALSAPLRSRFGFTARLDFYDVATLALIVARSSLLLGVKLEEGAAEEIARRSRGTPRIANNLLRWVRDFAQMRAGGIVTQEVAKSALDMLAIDNEGLDEVDKKLLDVIIEQYEGGPVGLKAIAAALGEDQATIETYEPYLIMKGLLRRTPRGREVTAQAYAHRGKAMPKQKECVE